MAVAPGPGWTDVATAIGTLAAALAAAGAAIAAVWIALWSDKQAGKRLEQERQASDQRLLEERKAADYRLGVELKHSESQLAEERTEVSARDQEADARAVQVVTAWTWGETTSYDAYGDAQEQEKITVAIVINHGRHTINSVEAVFCMPDGVRVLPKQVERVTGWPRLAKELQDGMAGPLQDIRADTLSPWDTGFRFHSAPARPGDPVPAYAIITWMDRWGAKWQHRSGDASQQDMRGPIDDAKLD